MKYFSGKNVIVGCIYRHPCICNISIDFKKLNKKKYLVNANWDAILEVNNGNVDKSFESFITTVNSVIAEHAPLKKYLLKNEN